MKLKLTSFNSKIAKQLFLQFFVLIILPVILISVVSFYNLKDVIKEESYSSLSRSAKNYGLDIHERLTNAENILNEAAYLTELKNSSDLISFDFLDLYFSNYLIYYKSDIVFIKNEALLQSTLNLIDIDLSMALNFISSSNQLLMISQKGDYYLVGFLESEYLWPNSALNSDEDLCVVTSSFQVMYCSQIIPLDTLEFILNSPPNTPLLWDYDDVTMVSSKWPLFMRYAFSNNDWLIILSKPEKVIFESVSDFRTSFLPALLFIVLMVIFLMIYTIRRHLRPIEAIIEGTRAVANSQLDYSVYVDTKDEYEELANSFNRMTNSLSFDFQYNKTLLKINENILLNKSISFCAGLILKELSCFGPILHSSLFIRNPHSANNVVLYNYDHEKNIFKVNMSVQEKSLCGLTELFESNAYMQSDYPYLLGDLIYFSNDFEYSLYPLIKDDILIAFILIATVDIVRYDKMLDYLSHSVVSFNSLQRAEVLERNAYFDKLTGIHNRAFFENQVKQIKNEIADKSYVLLFIDLDRFKNINDTLGHSVGDQMLVGVAHHFKQVLPHDSLLARFSGDEFIAFIELIDKDECFYAKHVIDSMNRTFSVNDFTLSISISVGVVVVNSYNYIFEDILKHADLAMYEAKKTGCNRFYIYDHSLQTNLIRKNYLEEFLKSVVDDENISLYYQPKIDIQTKCLSGFEALSRFNHPVEGHIRPDILFALAEETGLIQLLGNEVLRQALTQLKIWIDQGIWGDLRLSVNVSPLQILMPSFLANFEQLLENTGVLPIYLEFEITEGIFIDKDSKAVPTLKYLQSLGIHISIDDFGTGYSSLAYLSNLPVDTLKIDKCFVTNVVQGDKHIGLIKSIISIGHNMGLVVIAEGVETQAELELLVDNDCDQIQGYLYSRPLPAQNIESILLAPNVDSIFDTLH